MKQRRTSGRALTEACLACIHDHAGEGSRAFTRVYDQSALATAQASDEARKTGRPLPELAGIPVSIKDLFDVAGEATLAGSTVLRGAAPAAADAAVVSRLRRAGAVIVGRTNMTEFACSGIGMNPHYGTPRAPWQRALGRIPGGSSSGAAVSVTDGMAAYAIGTDTGGSVRIPAALCGIVGFKPTARRVPRDGCFPLAPSLDSIGPIAPSVRCCIAIDSVLAGDDTTPSFEALPVSGLRFGVPEHHVLDDLDPEVARAFSRALTLLSAAGAHIEDLDFPRLADVAAMNTPVALAAIEGYAVHRRLLSEQEKQYDPRVSSRFQRGREASAADYIDLLANRKSFVRRASEAMAPFDAIVMPTVALVSPPIADLEASDDAYFKANARALRNAMLVNLFDGTALSIPCHEAGTAPVGFMLAGAADADRRLLAVGLAVERVLGG